MEAWNIAQYRRPVLDVDRIEATLTGCSVFRGTQRFDMDIDGSGPDAHQAVAVVESLTEPGAQAWSEIRQRPDDWAFVAQLDAYGLIKESADDIGRNAREEAAALESQVSRAAQWVRDAVPARQLSRIRVMAGSLLRVAAAVERGRLVGEGVELQRGFFPALLARQMRCWCETSPPSFRAAVAILRSLASPDRRSPKTRHAGAVDDTSLYEPAMIAAHVSSFAVCLALAATPVSRTSPPPPRVRGWASGINVMLAAERYVAECLEAFGDTSLGRRLGTGAVSARFAQALYVEQYHLSGRFVQILAPVLSLEVRKTLRERLLRYHAEEVGHDALEREAALSVGVTPDALSQAVPLPLFSAYLDVLTDLARHNTVGLLASIVVAEGFPGAGNPVNAALERAGLAAEWDRIREHERLNDQLHHSAVPRLMMSALPAIAPATQLAAFHDLAFVVEINCRAWNMLVSYCDEEPLPFIGVGRRAYALQSFSVLS